MKTDSDPKQALRQQLIKYRKELPDTLYRHYSAQICEHINQAFPQLSTMRVGFYWPIKNEPDLRPLIESWMVSQRPGFSALLPVIQNADSPLVFRVWTPQSQMTIGQYGIPTLTDGEFMSPDVLLIPAVGFDRKCNRLGYGGGFFDRTLATIWPKPLCIGVSYQFGLIDTTCPVPHDIPLDAIVSEEGVIYPDSSC